MDFWVWSSTSRSGSHVLDLDASDVRLSSGFFLFCLFLGPFHVLKAECSRPSWNLKKLGGISGCVGWNEWASGFLSMCSMDG